MTARLSLPMVRALLRMRPNETYLHGYLPCTSATADALVSRGLARWPEWLQLELTPAGIAEHNRLREQWGDGEP